MIGVVIFTDTDGDGNVTVAKGVAAYPSKYSVFLEYVKSLEA